MNSRSASRVPVLPASGVLGHLQAFRRDPLALLTRGVRERGDAVDFRLFTRHLVLLAHPDQVRRVLQEHASGYDKGTRGFEVLRTLLRDGLLTSEGAHWLRQRRIAQPAFHRSRIATFGQTMTRAAEALVDRWRPGETVDLSADMMRLTLRIVGETLLSTDVTTEADRVGAALHVTLGHANEALGRILPRPLWWPGGKGRALRAAVATLDTVILDIIAARRVAAGPGPDDLLTMLMEARDEETGETMNDAQLRDEVMTIFLAGHETTALALGWTWHLLARHPEVRERLHAAVDSALAGRSPTLDDLPRLGYVEQVVKEAMRLYPPAWAISRRALADDVVGGYAIPRGTIVLVSPYVTHRHPALWPAPDRFDPEHFDPDRERARPAFTYFPFGGGPRQCIGNSFAMLELVLVVAAIARRCRLDPVSDEEVGTNPSITLRPARPIAMRVTPR